MAAYKICKITIAKRDIFNDRTIVQTARYRQLSNQKRLSSVPLKYQILPCASNHFSNSSHQHHNHHCQRIPKASRCAFIVLLPFSTMLSKDTTAKTSKSSPRPSSPSPCKNLNIPTTLVLTSPAFCPNPA